MILFLPSSPPPLLFVSHSLTCWAVKMAQQLRALAVNPEDLSLIPRAHLVQGENHPILTCCGIYVHLYT